ncbi:hypothetical protein BTA37_27045 [Priestia megaterium]|uniref:DUF2642 domain-containing protein n=1 Tax=Priestia megaterium TaxID=1404 RepID=UPI00094C84A3|nr:DUF2642 domain-containing protein [Priestia megaterium]OLO26736.1 hypothetical protein BTA37_27045 [Priestia megaterium]
MGSNGFSSERKQKRVDLLKQLLDTNISTHGSSNPLEALLSGLDLGSLEGLMQKNKKSHHDDWDSKKKRHHDDCSDHDWDHKKKHDHDDCGCKKKKHDHDDWDHKKKRHHDDCGCNGHKHHKNPCDKCFKHDCCCKDKKKKRCNCDREDTQALREAINAVCRAINATPFVRTLFDTALDALEPLLNNDCIDEDIVEDLTAIIEAIPTTGPISPELLGELGRQLNRLRRCLGLRFSVCSPDGGGGDNCGTCDVLTRVRLRIAINAVCVELQAPTIDLEELQADITVLLPLLTASCISNSVRIAVAQAGEAVLLLSELDEEALVELGLALTALRVCIGIDTGQTCEPDFTPGGGGAPIPSPISTIRQRLLDLLADQVVITTPTGIYGGTLVAVQADYIAVVAPTGTYLIPLDQIQTFTTE